MKAPPRIAIAPPIPMPDSGLSPAMLMIVIIARPRPTITIPNERDRAAAGASRDAADVHRGIDIGERNLSAFDHRHSLAVLHLELLRTLPQAQENDENAGKHAEDEDQCEEFFSLTFALQFC